MKEKSFTLVELLIVVMIIGILATLAVPQYQKMVERAEAAEAIQNIGSIMRSVSRYYMEHQDYPRTGQPGDVYGSAVPWVAHVRPFNTSGLDIALDESSPNLKWQYLIETWPSCNHGNDTDYTVCACPHDILPNTSDPDERARMWHGHMKEGQIVGKIANKYTVAGQNGHANDFEEDH